MSASTPLSTVLLAGVVAATAAILFTRDVRAPKTAESAAFLILPAASYLVDPSLPPALAILFIVLCLKAYPMVKSVSESFTVAAPNYPKRGPKPENIPGLEKGALAYDAPDLDASDRYKRALATPEALHDAQNNLVPST